MVTGLAFKFNLTASGGKIDLLMMNDVFDVNWNAVWDIYPTNILMLKFNYWFSL